MQHFYQVRQAKLSAVMHYACLLSLLMSLLMSLISFSAEVFAKPNFKDWLAQVRQEALAAGISVKTVDKTIKHIQWLPSVIKLDHRQPEFVTTFEGYYYSHVTPSRVRTGRQKLRTFRSLLAQLEKQYGIPPNNLVSTLGARDKLRRF